MNNFKNDREFLEAKAALLKAIAHPVRLCILRNLTKNKELQVNDMKNCLEIPQSTVSQHIGVLKKENLITGRREGTCIYYSLADEDIKNLIKNILEEL